MEAKALLSICGSLMLIFAIKVHGMSLREVLNSREDLSESANFARESGILDDIESNAYGDITVLFPSNDAWRDVSEGRKAYLLDPDNKEDLETLLLFSTTDALIKKSDVYYGMPPLVTLLGVEATVNKAEDEVCILSLETGMNYECANIVTWDIDIDDGIIHIINRVLFPEELDEVLKLADEQTIAPWRRMQGDGEDARTEEKKQIL